MNAFWRGLVVSALGLGASLAQAGGINWSIGISLPPVSTVISNDPYHRPYYEPPPVYVAPPVVYRPAPVYHAPPAVIYRPVPIAVVPGYIVDRHWSPPPREWRHHRGHEHRRGRGHDHGHGYPRWDGHDDHGRGYRGGYGR